MSVCAYVWCCLCVCVCSVGLRAVFKNHALNGVADLYSPHAFLGLAVVSLFCLNVGKRP